MKSNILLAITCLALGATISWFAKPDSSTNITELEGDHDSPSENPSPSPESKRTISEHKATESDRDPKVEFRTFLGNDDEDQTSKIQDQMSEMFKKRQMGKIDARISKLVAQLNLTPKQEAALRKVAKEKMSSFGDIFSDNADPSNIGDLLKGDPLDVALADILTPEQKEEHEVVKKRELTNKVEAKALKSLAKLSNLDLSQEQKDQAYDILYKQAETSVTDDSGASAMVTMFTDGMGIELDSEALDITGAMIPTAEDLENGAGEQPDPKEMMARAKENMNQRIDDKVEALRPVLNDTQLEQYRKDLELKSGGIFGGLLQGFGESAE